ncbi:MAG TPA: hypothetical protein VMH28_26405 [Candidatus Acidoferrales bacterium]|nr:hypothetical protein [Candidatus Acidoferrales bacterium]
MRVWLAVTLFGAALSAAETPPTAAALIEEAKARAASGNRAIFLVFGASW